MFMQMGQWTSAYREDSGTESDEEDDIDDSHRPPSPAPILPVPSPEEFRKLTIPGQFAYVKPVLVATLNDAYAPAKQRHDDFMRGGKYRADVMKDVTMRGNIPVGDVQAFGTCLGRWALREERRAQRMLGEGAVADEGDTMVSCVRWCSVIRR